MREIDGAALAFQQKLNGLWEEYRALYDRVEAAADVRTSCLARPQGAAAGAVAGLRGGSARRPGCMGASAATSAGLSPPRHPRRPSRRPLQEAAAAAAKQHAAAVRGLEELREGLRAKAGALQAKIERGSRKAGKMPELAQMLAPFLGRD